MPRSSKPTPNMLDAIYRTASNPAHRGNICIEALPPFRTAEDMSSVFGNYPPFDPQERSLPKADRMMAILSLRDLFEPLAQHEELCDRIGTIVRHGYTGRNPVAEGANRHQVELYRRIMDGEMLPINAATCSTAASLAVYGGSGTGKTSVIQRATDFLPQVLWHGRHGLVQIVWMRLDCPSDGSPIQLLQSLLAKVDALIGSSYADDNRRSGLPTLIRVVSSVAARHNVGLIVLDEVQRVLLARGAHTKALLDFFVSLANEVQVPILFAGTRAARKLLEAGPFEVARRCGEFGSYELEPLARGREWERLVTSLLDYQWTRHAIDPDGTAGDAEREAFSLALHHESQGILALAVRLFQMAQIQAIDGGGERVTPAMVRDVAARRFGVLQPVLEVLRRGGDAIRYDLFFEAALMSVGSRVEHLAGAADQPGGGAGGAREAATETLGKVYKRDQAAAAVEAAARERPDLDAPDLLDAALDRLKPSLPSPRQPRARTLRDVLGDRDGAGDGVDHLLGTVEEEADRMAARPGPAP